jgi:hypothetical protein
MAPLNTSQSGIRQRARATVKNSTVVMRIVPVTATPYAAARLAEERNPRTSSTTAIRTIALIAGRYTWPTSTREVCRTVRRGK